MIRLILVRSVVLQFLSLFCQPQSDCEGFWFQVVLLAMSMRTTAWHFPVNLLHPHEDTVNLIPQPDNMNSNPLSRLVKAVL